MSKDGYSSKNPVPTRLVHPDIGDTLLFCIHKNGGGSETLRPLIVTNVETRLTADGETEYPVVYGTVILQVPPDAQATWVRTCNFYAPTPQNPYLQVKAVFQGHGIGQWRMK